jgi:cation diffusion facilitator family transporter
MQNGERNSLRSARAQKITLLGMALNLLLVGAKIAAGVLARSSAVVADGFHSLSDVATDIALIVGLRFADKPPDGNHKYGHGKIETISALSVAAVLAFVGGKLLYDGIGKTMAILDGEIPPVPGWLAVGVAVVSVIVKEWLFRRTRTIGEETENRALMANAWHHRSDALSSIGVAVGVSAAIILGGKWLILDPIAAVEVSVLILGAAVSIAKDCFAELMETSLGAEVEEDIRKISLKVDGVLDPHQIRTRRIGKDIAIDMHIHVERGMSITSAHDICTEVEDSLRERFGDSTFVTVHCEPTDE